MIKVFNKTINILIALVFIGGLAFGIEAEYKNSLIRVELTKTNEDSYKIDLYTQKKYTEPLKVVKKNDLNYYILLPETNNSPSKKSVNSADIKSLSTNLYPYAGADINNGYTKIEINTNKPINFTVSAKSTQSQKTAQTQTTGQKTAQTTPKKEPATTVAQKQPANIKPKKEVGEKIAQSNKTVAKEPIKKETAPKKQETKKEVVKVEPAKKEVQKPVEKKATKPVEVQKPTVEKKEVKETTKKETPKEPVQLPETFKSPDLNSAVQEEIKTEETVEPQQVDDVIDDYSNPVVEDNPYSYNDNFLTTTKAAIEPYKNKLSNKLNQMNLDLKDAVFIGVIALLMFLFLVVLLVKKPKKEPKIKRKSALVEPKAEEVKPQVEKVAATPVEQPKQPEINKPEVQEAQNNIVHQKTATPPPYKEFLADETPQKQNESIANNYPSSQSETPVNNISKSTLDRFRTLEESAKKPHSTPQVQPEVRPQVQIQPQVSPQPQIQPQIQPQTKPQIQPGVQPQTQTPQPTPTMPTIPVLPSEPAYNRVQQPKQPIHKPTLPTTVTESYERLSYEPKINTINQTNVQKTPQTSQYRPFKPDIIDDTQQENEIIQKILQEDTFVEIEPQEFKYEQPKKFERKPSFETETFEEPKVISKIEIAPNRGFMCVSYKNNINLMGYIHDDVFALYNFQTSQLKDYNIRFRMTEKTDKGANFIVKIDSVKMLIAVTRSSMNLEVAM